MLIITVVVVMMLSFCYYWFTEICRVSGWGRMTEGGASSSTLLYVDLPVLSDEECAKSYVNDELFPSMLCAG